MNEIPANVVTLPKSVRKYEALLKFDNGKMARVQIEAGDHVGAAAKLAGLFSDQPRPVKEWKVRELEEERRIILPAPGARIPA